MREIFVNCRFVTQELSGVQRFASEIALGLKRLDPSIRFVSPRSIRQESWADELAVECVGAHSGHLWEQSDLALFMRRRQNALLVNLGNTAPLTVARQIVTVHDLAFLVHPEWFGWRFGTLYRFLVPRVVRRSAHVVVNSRFTERELVNRLHLNASNLTVIPCAASKRLGTGDSASMTPVSGAFILAVASMDPRKNLNAVLAAYRRLRRHDTKLVLVGGYHPSFRSQRVHIGSDEADRIILMGRVSDNTLSWLYQRAVLLVYPSLYEGFGLPPIEAAAAGCPCVVSREAALPEVMGDAALYCDAYSIADIAAQMERLLVDSQLRADLIDLGRVRAGTFSWEQSVMQMHAVIRRVAGP